MFKKVRGRLAGRVLVIRNSAVMSIIEGPARLLDWGRGDGQRSQRGLALCQNSTEWLRTYQKCASVKGVRP